MQQKPFDHTEYFDQKIADKCKEVYDLCEQQGIPCAMLFQTRGGCDAATMTAFINVDSDIASPSFVQLMNLAAHAEMIPPPERY